MQKKDRYYEIDLLRFFAALSVVFFHYTFRGYAANDMSPLEFETIGQLSRYGYLGVDLFFLISGFVILMTAQNRSGKDFVISRVTRLYPAFWICVTLTAIVIALFGAPRFFVTLPQYIFNLSMLGGYFDIAAVDGVYWSLFVELKFYLLILILILFGQIPRISIYLGLWLLFVVSCHLTSVPQVLKDILFPNWAPYFISGAMFFLIRQSGFSLYRIGVLSGSFALAIYNATALDGWMRFYNAGISEEVVAGVVTGFYLFFLLIAMGRTRSMQRKSFLAWGALTYPLYLIHQNVGYIFFQTFDNNSTKYLSLTGMIVLALGASFLINKYIENPLSAWMKRMLRDLFNVIHSQVRAIPRRHFRPD